MFRRMTADIFAIRAELKQLQLLLDNAARMNEEKMADYFYLKVKPHMGAVRRRILPDMRSR